MKRIMKVLVVMSVIAVWVAAAASAASSPTVITGAASAITDTTAVLHGRLNPNGIQTGYLFDYGTTTAFGLTSASRSAGRGNAGANVAEAIGGLTPGTVYYYRISATSTAGTTFGATRAFTTTGAPPPAVVTGGAVNVRKTVATPTGTISSNGAYTVWQVQYGLTTSYGLSTFNQVLSPIVLAPLPVSIEIPGLAPATLFHYRLIAYHGNATTAGLDQTFFTEPDRRPTPRLSPRTSPGSDPKSPFVFTTTGTLNGAGFIPAPDRCTGNVGVRFDNGRKQLAEVVAPVGGDCKFSAQASIKRIHARGPVRLRVTVDFRGNGYLAPVNRLNYVTAG